MPILRALAAATVLAAASAPALAAPVIGGQSVVRVLVPLAPAIIEATGAASQSGTDIILPLIGGDAALSAASTYGATGVLVHDGGIRVTVPPNTLGYPQAVLDFTDIVVDFDLNEVRADIAQFSIPVIDDAVLLYFLGGVTPTQLTDLANPLQQMNISSFTEVIVKSAFGLFVDTTQRFGTFATAPLFGVPAPAGVALFGLGIAAIGLRRR